MVNQQLLDYIKAELAKGTSREHIKGILTSNEWTNQDVDEAFNSIASAQPETQATTQALQFSKKNSHSKALIISLLVALLLLGGAVFAYMNNYISIDINSIERIFEKIFAAISNS